MFEGRVVEILPKGGRSVQLLNGHRITARTPSYGLLADIGDRVGVELPLDRMTGWRLMRSLPSTG